MSSKIQIIIPPLRKTTTIYPPYGAMYIASSLLEDGHDVQIINVDAERINHSEVCERVRRYMPDVVGFSATVATSYKYVKEISRIINERFPHVVIIVGGGLAAAAEVVLNNTSVTVVVAGEGDITVKEVVERIEKNGNLSDIQGIVYKDGDKIIKTEPRTLIKKLDTLKYPGFDLVDMNVYMKNIFDVITGFHGYKDMGYDRRFYEPHRNTRILRVPISRGCFARCSFCYRHMLGIRHFSFDYIFDFIEYLSDRYNTNQFSFGDECFAPNKVWNWKFIENYKKRKLDIMFQVLGMRVDTVDRDILKAYKDIGCWMIEYGFESGSQRMLDVIDKRVRVEQNVNTALWTKEAGIFTSPTLVLGMPGESTETIYETIDALKRMNYGSRVWQSTFAMAMPGAPLYEYAKLKGLITDEDNYLESINDLNASDVIDLDAFINFTDEPKEVVSNWPTLISKELQKHFSKNIIIDYYLKILFIEKIRNLYKRFKKDGILPTLKVLFKKIISKIFLLSRRLNRHMEAKGTEGTKRKTHDIRFWKEIDNTEREIIRGESLRKVISRIQGEG